MRAVIPGMPLACRLSPRGWPRRHRLLQHLADHKAHDPPGRNGRRGPGLRVRPTRARFARTCHVPKWRRITGSPAGGPPGGRSRVAGSDALPPRALGAPPRARGLLYWAAPTGCVRGGVPSSFLHTRKVRHMDHILGAELWLFAADDPAGAGGTGGLLLLATPTGNTGIGCRGRNIRTRPICKPWPCITLVPSGWMK